MIGISGLFFPRGMLTLLTTAIRPTGNDGRSFATTLLGSTKYCRRWTIQTRCGCIRGRKEVPASFPIGEQTVRETSD